MNKKVFGKKLSRSRPAREALFASLMRAMILNGKIETTRAKAKAVVGSLEKIVTSAKKGDLASRRRILAQLDNQRDALLALYEKILPIFSKKSSGFIRLVSLPSRKGDNAQMVRMEWTEKLTETQKVEKQNKKTKKTADKQEEKKTDKK